MKVRKLLALILTGVIALATFAGCAKSGFNVNSDITVISREDGSGTRGAFVELLGIEQKDASGEKVDHTVETADITQSTGVMITSVSQNVHAIGYISLGSLDDKVKPLKIDNAAPTVENIKNGSYKISRPFNIATKDNLPDVAKDFIEFILSSEGQKVVEDSGYISSSSKTAYNGRRPSGKITIAGSSSVSPVMEKLKEAYLAININASIEINQSDSTIGRTNCRGNSRFNLHSRNSGSNTEQFVRLRPNSFRSLICAMDRGFKYRTSLCNGSGAFNYCNWTEYAE